MYNNTLYPINEWYNNIMITKCVCPTCIYMYMHVYSTKDEGCAYMCMKQAKEETNLTHCIYDDTQTNSIAYEYRGLPLLCYNADSQLSQKLSKIIYTCMDM